MKKPYEPPTITRASSAAFDGLALEYARACAAMANALYQMQGCWCEHHVGPHQWLEDE